jgi:uncharacterized alkaline shock family protein YloU
MSKYKYHLIKNFTTNGNLGISTKTISEIATQAIKEVEGVEIPDSHSVLFKTEPVSCKFNAKGDLTLNVFIRVQYGYNVGEVCSFLQERIEQVLMFTTEIKPKKINIKVDNVKS